MPFRCETVRSDRISWAADRQESSAVFVAGLPDGGGDERAVRHRSFITPLLIIQRKTRRARRNGKRRGKEKRRGSGMEATWLPTAIRGGGRHESHDDVTATIATSRRGQYVSLSKLRAVPSALAASSTLHRPVHRVPGGQKERRGRWWQWYSKRGRSLDASSLDQNP